MPQPAPLRLMKLQNKYVLRRLRKDDGESGTANNVAWRVFDIRAALSTCQQFLVVPIARPSAFLHVFFAPQSPHVAHARPGYALVAAATSPAFAEKGRMAGGRDVGALRVTDVASRRLEDCRDRDRGRPSWARAPQI